MSHTIAIKIGDIGYGMYVDLVKYDMRYARYDHLNMILKKHELCL